MDLTLGFVREVGEGQSNKAPESPEEEVWSLRKRKPFRNAYMHP